jgi:hypothetical protein
VFWPIWIVNAILQWALLARILLGDRWRQHPAFAIYIAFCCCKTTLLIGVMLFFRSQYFALNWASRLVGLPLLIAVLVEVFAAVFRPYSTLPEGTFRLFRIAFSFLVLLTTIAAIFFPGPAPGNLANTVFVANRSLSVIFVGCFGFTALFSSYFGIPWQHRTYGIGVGFLLFMSVDLFISSVAAVYGMAIAVALRAPSMLAFSLALITWLVYFFRPDIPSRPPTLEQLKRLQKALDYPAQKAESFEGRVKVLTDVSGKGLK